MQQNLHYCMNNVKTHGLLRCTVEKQKLGWSVITGTYKEWTTTSPKIYIY